VAVVEQHVDVFPLPRAAHFDGEVMRVLQQLELTDALLPQLHAGAGMHFVTADGRPLVRFDPPPRLGSQGWHTGYFFHQPELEGALRAGLDRHPHIEVQFGTAVTGIETSLSTTCVQTSTGSLTTRWVVACDGARSPTRDDRGMGLDDLEFDQPWLVLDVIVHGAVDLPPVCQQICDPTRPTTFVPMPGARRRWEFMLMPGEDPDAMTDPEVARALVGRWLPPERFEIDRWALYTFHAMVAQRWRDGSIFLAGDAAHQMPPFLGQGMCSGIRDVVNLSWKFAAVQRGDASDELLETYQTEREPHVRAIIGRAVEAGALIQATDPDVARARDEHLLSQAAAAPMTNEPSLVEMGIRLGPGVLDDGGAGFQVGSIGPQLVVEEPGGNGGDDTVVRIDTLVGNRAALLATVALPPSVIDTASRTSIAVITIDATKRSVSVDEVVVDGALDVVQTDVTALADVTLLRPDRYVYGSSTMSEAHALVERYAARLGVSVAPN
jgi:3-(3-hydroxy-phenyl)propionate hydroxylase